MCACLPQHTAANKCKYASSSGSRPQFAATSSGLVIVRVHTHVCFHLLSFSFEVWYIVMVLCHLTINSHLKGRDDYQWEIALATRVFYRGEKIVGSDITIDLRAQTCTHSLQTHQTHTLGVTRWTRETPGVFHCSLRMNETWKTTDTYSTEWSVVCMAKTNTP